MASTTKTNKREYMAKAVACVFDVSKNKGTEYTRVRFECIEEGPLRGEQSEWDGYYSEKTAQRTLDALMTMGWAGEDPSSIDTADIGNPVRIVVEDETYTDDHGKTYPPRARVQWVNDPGRTAVRAVDPAVKAGFKEKMKGLVAATREAREKAKSGGSGTSFEYGANAPAAQAAAGTRKAWE